MNIQEKINTLLHILEFKNLKIFADHITNGNLDRAKGLSSGRIKKFNPCELKILINNSTFAHKTELVFSVNS